MATIFNHAFTAAETTQLSNVWQLGRNGTFKKPRSLFIQGSFVYGSGGSSVDAWVQTSFDGGNSWWDVAQFSFVQTTARRGYNLSALTPKASILTPTDGALSANTSVDGIIGPLWRVKYTSVVLYAATTLIIDVDSDIQFTPKIQ